ncbi:MAG: hypothetical protein WD625_06025 [Balneolales bacterium]
MILQKRSILTIIALLLCLTSIETMAHGQDDIDILIQKAETYFLDQKNREALDMYLSVLDIDATNYEALHNTSLLYNMEGFQFDDEDERMKYYKLAESYAERALEHHPDKDESHYVYSIALGRIADKSSARNRVKAAKAIKEHGEKALELNPEHAGAWHLLAVWHHNAANLNFAERTAVRLLGGLPDASNEKAEEAFNKAIALDDETIIFYRDFARFYDEVGKKQKAEQMLNKVVTLEPKVEGDEKILEESREMLSSIR